MIKSISTGLIYRNPNPHLSSKQAYFPSVVLMENGEMLAAFVIGQAFESVDIRTYISRSKDMGETWSDPELLLKEQPNKLLTDGSRITSVPGGEIVAMVHQCHREDHPDGGFANPENLGFIRTDMVLARSTDFGHTWNVSKPLEAPLVGPSFELCSPIMVFKDGRWIWPTSTWRNWEGYEPNGMKMVAWVSHDKGKTWPEFMDVMDGNAEKVIHWESKVIELKSGPLLSVAWAYDEAQGKDLPNRYTISRDGGATWLSPRSTNIQGQTMAIVELPDERLLTVYRRMDKPGLWTSISKIEGDNWINLDEAALWGSNEKGLQNKSENMVHDFNELKFGAPCITLLPDNSVHVAFWCYEKMVSNIRWFKFTV